MITHAHILSWNEEKILPFTLDYYSTFCDKIFVWDNMSTDNSDKIYKKYPNVIVKKWSSDNTINDLRYKQIKSTCYREISRNEADWVIVCDCDEILYHPNLINKLKELKDRNIDTPKIDGRDMVSEVFPVYDGELITSKIKYGSSTYEPMCKNILFNPKKDIEFGFGGHSYHCRDCSTTNDFELNLLHYKFLSLDYVSGRYKILNSRLSDYNKKTGFGSHYTQKNATEYMELLLNNKIKIIN